MLPNVKSTYPAGPVTQDNPRLLEKLRAPPRVGCSDLLGLTVNWFLCSKWRDAGHPTGKGRSCKCSLTPTWNCGEQCVDACRIISGHWITLVINLHRCQKTTTCLACLLVWWSHFCPQF